MAWIFFRESTRHNNAAPTVGAFIAADAETMADVVALSDKVEDCALMRPGASLWPGRLRDKHSSERPAKKQMFRHVCMATACASAHKPGRWGKVEGVPRPVLFLESKSELQGQSVMLDLTLSLLWGFAHDGLLFQLKEAPFRT